jgi:hypothetical protein
MNILLAVAGAVVLLNLPFGYWRAGIRRFSLAWFLAVHFPIPCVVALRIFSGLGWQLATFPVIIAAYLGGQWLGAALRRYLKGNA